MPTLTDYMNRTSPAVRNAMNLGLYEYTGLERAPGSRFGYSFGVKDAFARGGWKAAGMAGLRPIGFSGFSAYQGYQDGGLTGAAGQVAIDTAVWSGIRGLAAHGGHQALAFNAPLMKQVGNIPSFAKGVGKGSLRFLANPYVAAGAATLAAGAGMAYGGYKVADASWKYHMKTLPLETAGSTQSFNTGNAATMRQRSMLSIQRSHLNARSAFGNEAQWAHISRYRGIGRRGSM